MTEIFAHQESYDWDAPGQLSIIVQGPVFSSNIIDTASFCTHWKSLFPNCELILSISATEFLVSGDTIALYQKNRGFNEAYGIVANAISALNAVCDKVVFAQTGAIPLPPITNDSPAANNFNLQLSAAQAGLRVAKGLYCLRVRSDFLFLDRSFITQYEERVLVKRGSSARLYQRVLISWLYTLNPYANEKFSFHYSDWFHFGLTTDLVDLWDVPPMSFYDATFYRHQTAVDTESRKERRFYPRLSIEQHLTFNWAKKHFDDISLVHRSDHISRDASVDILVDNFVPCDLLAAGAFFPKYEADFNHPEKAVQCITPGSWLMLAECDSHERPHLLQKFAEPSSARGSAPFPRCFPAATLTPKDAFRSKGAITNAKRTGLLFFGPYTDMPPGNYRVTIGLSALSSEGHLRFGVTSNQGQRQLGGASFETHVCGSRPWVDFKIEGFGADQVELICEIQDVDLVSVSEIVFEQLPEKEEAFVEQVVKP